MSGQINWEPMEEKEIDVEFAKLSKLIAKKITIIFGIPPHDLGDLVVVEGLATLVPLSEEEKALVTRCEEKISKEGD